MVTRPSWHVFRAINRVPDGSPWNLKLDNCDGGGSGDGWPYAPNEEDRSAIDWMLYQAPQQNWVELDFYNG